MKQVFLLILAAILFIFVVGMMGLMTYQRLQAIDRADFLQAQLTEVQAQHKGLVDAKDNALAELQTAKQGNEAKIEEQFYRGIYASCIVMGLGSIKARHEDGYKPTETDRMQLIAGCKKFVVAGIAAKAYKMTWGGFDPEPSKQPAETY